MINIKDNKNLIEHIRDLNAQRHYGTYQPFLKASFELGGFSEGSKHILVLNYNGELVVCGYPSEEALKKGIAEYDKKILSVWIDDVQYQHAVKTTVTVEIVVTPFG